MKHLLRRLESTFKSNFGFTLLELLVVISIIGILVALGTVSYTTAQQKARDAKRRGDMKAWAAALEQYNSNNASSYPTSATCDMGGTSSTYLPAGIPTDPKGVAPYVYTPVCVAGGTSFCICADLESGGTTGNSNSPGNNTCSGLGTPGAYYCVKNQQ